MDSVQVATSTYVALFGMVSGFALMIIITDDAGAQTVYNFTIAERSFPLSYQGTEAGRGPWAVLCTVRGGLERARIPARM